MRLLVRFVLILLICFLALILLYFIFNKNEMDSDAVETIRLLQSIDASSANVAGGATAARPMPTNVAIVLAVSLLSIALLISAIVIVAITLYPSNEDTDDDEQMIRLVDRSDGADNDDDLVFVAEADAPDCKGSAANGACIVSQHDFHPFAKIINNNNIVDYEHILHYY